MFKDILPQFLLGHLPKGGIFLVRVIVTADQDKVHMERLPVSGEGGGKRIEKGFLVVLIPVDDPVLIQHRNTGDRRLFFTDKGDIAEFVHDLVHISFRSLADFPVVRENSDKAADGVIVFHQAFLSRINIRVLIFPVLCNVDKEGPYILRRPVIFRKPRKNGFVERFLVQETLTEFDDPIPSTLFTKPVEERKVQPESSSISRSCSELTSCPLCASAIAPSFDF